MKFILSPCGTSLLTNQARDNEERKLVFKHANEKSPDAIPADERIALENLLRRAGASLRAADLQNAARMSAEINGIIKLYEGRITDSPDYHFLLATDTWLGEQAARLVEQWLKTVNSRFMVILQRQNDLQTRDIMLFQSALSDLIRLLSEEIPRYRDSGYHIVFNLTGGFKSVQGFLQSIANFYADETIYIFESATELMRIPRLPVRMDAEGIIEANLTAFRNLVNGQSVTLPPGIPETLLMTVEGETTLSPWGELVWQTCRMALYRRCLWPSPDPGRIRYTLAFERDTGELQADKLEALNTRIDQLQGFLSGVNPNVKNLDFKKLNGKVQGSTHQVDAWAQRGAWRILGHFEEATFVLDRLLPHD